MWAWAARARESAREGEREHGRGEALRVLHALATITELGGKIPTYTHPFVHTNHHKHTLSHSRTSPLQLLSALPLIEEFPAVVVVATICKMESNKSYWEGGHQTLPVDDDGTQLDDDGKPLRISNQHNSLPCRYSCRGEFRVGECVVVVMNVRWIGFLVLSSCVCKCLRGCKF